AGAERQRAAPRQGARAPRPTATPAPGQDTFRREGDYWLVVFEGREMRVRDLKGMRYLCRLLAEHGRELSALDLVALESGGHIAAPDLGDAGEMLDARAKQAYRRRLAETEQDLEEARGLGDLARVAQAQHERDFLVRELSRAVGLGGRDRRAGSASERARVSVTRAIRQAMARLRARDRALGQHLDQAIRTGTCCAYLPDPRLPARWAS
ncbi:MAG TPA: transcriptional regulator, partial [Thermoanaerobaculia bacterium]|nr:transcriptional regulator [Thermoanaerobaculia bacterium]